MGTDWLQLQVVVDCGVFETLRHEGGTTTLTWPVLATLPLGSSRNLSELDALLSRGMLWDLFFFDISFSFDDEVQLPPRFLNPCLTPLQHGLRNGSRISVTAAPLSHGVDPVSLVPLCTSDITFSRWGPFIRVSRQDARRAERVEGEGWNGGIVLFNQLPAISNDGTINFSFRISLAQDSMTRNHKVRAGSPSTMPLVGDEVPIAAIGLCDGSCDHTSTLYGTPQPRSWIVEPVSGTMLIGNESPSFLDRRLLRIAPIMTITISLHVHKGTVALIQHGNLLGRFQVPISLVEHLYPVAELCTAGSVVEML